MFQLGLAFIMRWHSISMRAGPAFLQFDWSKTGLSMDLPVFVYSHAKTSFKFLLRHGTYRAAFNVWLEIFYFNPRREKLTELLFCLDLSLSRSTDHQDRNLHSSFPVLMQLGHAVRPTILPLFIRV